MMDIIFPKNNEKEFIKTALKLGYKNICFLYDYKAKIKKIKEKNLDIFSGIITGPAEMKKARNADLIVVKSSEKDRHVFEKAKPDLIFDLELKAKKDFIHHRNSGLNHVLCNLAKKNKILVGFSLSSLLSTKDMLRSQIIGRIKQNIRLCRKYKIKTVLASFATTPYEMRSSHDLISLGISLGMHPKEAKESLQNALQKINSNKKKKSPDYIAEGIEIVS